MAGPLLRHRRSETGRKNRKMMACIHGRAEGCIYQALFAKGLRMGLVILLVLALEICKVRNLVHDPLLLCEAEQEDQRKDK